MATLTTIRSNVANILGLENGTSGDQPLIDFYANEAVRQILLDTRCYVTSTTVTPGATADYTISTALLDIVKMYWTVNGVQYFLERRPFEDIIDLRRNTAAVTPTVYYALIGASTLCWYPTPSASDVLTMYYVPYPTEMSSGSHDPSNTTYGGIPLEQHKLIVSYTCWKMADATDDQSSQMGAAYQREYEQGIVKMRRDLSKRGGAKLGPATLPSRRRGRRYVPRPDQVGA